MCRSPCLGPGGCRSTWAAAAERGFVLHESVSVGCSQPGLAGTEKPCFLEYKICSLPSLPGPQRVVLPSLEDQRPGLFLPPSPLLKLQQLVPRGGLQGLNPPNSPPSNEHPQNSLYKIEPQSGNAVSRSVLSHASVIHASFPVLCSLLDSPKISSRFLLFFFGGGTQEKGRSGEKRRQDGGRRQNQEHEARFRAMHFLQASRCQ